MVGKAGFEPAISRSRYHASLLPDVTLRHVRALNLASSSVPNRGARPGIQPKSAGPAPQHTASIQVPAMLFGAPSARPWSRSPSTSLSLRRCTEDLVPSRFRGPRSRRRAERASHVQRSPEPPSVRPPAAARVAKTQPYSRSDALSGGQRTGGWRRWPQSWELATIDSAGQNAHGSVQMGMAVRLLLYSGGQRTVDAADSARLDDR